MSGPRLPGGVVHELPADLRETLTGSADALEACCWPGCKHRERNGRA